MKILVPIDGSELALQALQHALALARAGLAVELVLANVQEPASAYEMLTLHDPEALAEVAVGAGRDLMAPAVKLADESGLPYAETVVVGDVVPALLEGVADIGVFADAVDPRGLECHFFRHDELVLVLPAGHRLAGRGPVSLVDALDEDWITLSDGAALLQRLQEAAMAARRPLRVRMQVRSFDTVCHLVASELGIAVLPRHAAMPLVRSMDLRWRPLSDPWASRNLVAAVRPGTQDPTTLSLLRFLVEPSQDTKPPKGKKQ